MEDFEPTLATRAQTDPTDPGVPLQHKTDMAVVHATVTAPHVRSTLVLFVGVEAEQRGRARAPPGGLHTCQAPYLHEYHHRSSQIIKASQSIISYAFPNIQDF